MPERYSHPAILWDPVANCRMGNPACYAGAPEISSETFDYLYYFDSGSGNHSLRALRPALRPVLIPALRPALEEDTSVWGVPTPARPTPARAEELVPLTTPLTNSDETDADEDYAIQECVDYSNRAPSELFDKYDISSVDSPDTISRVLNYNMGNKKTSVSISALLNVIKVSYYNLHWNLFISNNPSRFTPAYYTPGIFVRRSSITEEFYKNLETLTKKVFEEDTKLVWLMYFVSIKKVTKEKASFIVNFPKVEEGTLITGEQSKSFTLGFLSSSTRNLNQINKFKEQLLKLKETLQGLRKCSIHSISLTHTAPVLPTMAVIGVSPLQMKTEIYLGSIDPVVEKVRGGASTQTTQRTYSITPSFWVAESLVKGQYTRLYLDAKSKNREYHKLFSYLTNVLDVLKTKAVYSSKKEKLAQAPLYGVELEICSDYKITELIDNQRDLFFICKADASISGAGGTKAELVTVPMTRKAQLVAWAHWFDQGKYDNFDVSTKTTNGMHIHVDRKSFKSPHHISAFTYFFGAVHMLPFIYTMSERSGLKNFNYTPLPGLQGDTFKYIDLTPQRIERYFSQVRGGINLNKRPTIEVRVFKGIVSYANLAKNIDFVDSVLHFTRGISTIEKMDLSQYFSWLQATPKNKYRVLKEFLSPEKMDDVLKDASFMKTLIEAFSNRPLSRDPQNRTVFQKDLIDKSLGVSPFIPEYLNHMVKEHEHYLPLLVTSPKKWGRSKEGVLTIEGDVFSKPERALMYLRDVPLQKNYSRSKTILQKVS